VIESNAIEMEEEPKEQEEVVEEFRKFLDDVRPEDFGGS
jgi:hypothetical protein